jgi:hypothetical protein
VSDPVLIASEGSTEPVQTVFEHVLGWLQTNEIRDDFQTCYSLACILINDFNLFLDLDELNWRLEKLQNTLNAVCLVIFL